jgi:peptidoglycan hydrolase CwlO-like protein
MDFQIPLILADVDALTNWLKSVSALITSLIGIVGLFGAAGGLSVLFYRVNVLEKRFNECGERQKNDVSRLHDRIDHAEEQGQPLRELVKELQTDLKWIKQHLAKLENRAAHAYPGDFPPPPSVS